MLFEGTKLSTLSRINDNIVSASEINVFQRTTKKEQCRTEGE